MICREVPLQTIRREAEMLLHEQESEAARYFAEGAIAALQWMWDPESNQPPHEILSAAAGKTCIQ